MKVVWESFVSGVCFGAMFTMILVVLLSGWRDAKVIKNYVEGKIECVTIGGDFICREVQK